MNNFSLLEADQAIQSWLNTQETTNLRQNASQNSAQASDSSTQILQRLNQVGIEQISVQVHQLNQVEVATTNRQRDAMTQDINLRHINPSPTTVSSIAFDDFDGALFYNSPSQLIQALQFLHPQLRNEILSQLQDRLSEFPPPNNSTGHRRQQPITGLNTETENDFAASWEAQIESDIRREVRQMLSTLRARHFPSNELPLNQVHWVEITRRRHRQRRAEGHAQHHFQNNASSNEPRTRSENTTRTHNRANHHQNRLPNFDGLPHRIRVRTPEQYDQYRSRECPISMYQFGDIREPVELGRNIYDYGMLRQYFESGPNYAPILDPFRNQYSDFNDLIQHIRAIDVSDVARQNPVIPTTEPNRNVNQPSHQLPAHSQINRRISLQGPEDFRRYQNEICLVSRGNLFDLNHPVQLGHGFYELQQLERALAVNPRNQWGGPISDPLRITYPNQNELVQQLQAIDINREALDLWLEEQF